MMQTLDISDVKQTLDISAATQTLSPARHPQGARKSVLIVDDEQAIARALTRLLERDGYSVVTAADGNAAANALLRGSFDVVVSDIQMPGMTGVDLLGVVRAYDIEVPVILMTGAPSLDTAMDAVALGATQYLIKPTSNEDILKAIERAINYRASRRRKSSMRRIAAVAGSSAEHASLTARFDQAMKTLWMAFQPIISRKTSGLCGYEALVRCEERSLVSPLKLFEAAEKLGRLTELDARIRTLVPGPFAAAPSGALLFVNISPRSLLDPDLFRIDAPLTKIADRVVLELTERSALDDIDDLRARVSTLRYLGFRIAIDDLGAGYAGLSSIAATEPDFVKLDMSLVRGIADAPIQQRLVGAMTALCSELGVRVVAEGIETSEENDCVQKLGCELLQGYLFGRPGPI